MPEHFAHLKTSRGINVHLYARESCCITFAAEAHSSLIHVNAQDLLALRDMLDQALAHLNVECL